MKQPSYDEIRSQVTRRFRRFSWFIFHVIMAATTIGAIWLIDPTPQDGTPVLAMLWVGVLVYHAVKLFIDDAQDRAIENTWQRYSDAEVMDEKPKRKTRLADDYYEPEVIEDDSSVRLRNNTSKQN